MGSGGSRSVENRRGGFFGDRVTNGELEVSVFRGLDLGSEGLCAVGIDGADHEFTNAGVGRGAVEEYRGSIVDGYVVVCDL